MYSLIGDKSRGIADGGQSGNKYVCTSHGRSRFKLFYSFLEKNLEKERDIHSFRRDRVKISQLIRTGSSADTDTAEKS